MRRFHRKVRRWTRTTFTQDNISLSYIQNSRVSDAYPTKIFDPAGNFSEVKYRFDIGANVWGRSPTPAGAVSGKTTSREFNDLGQLQKEINDVTGAYVRYEFPSKSIEQRTFVTAADSNQDGVLNASDEVRSDILFDGGGHVTRSRTEFEFGSNGSATSWAGRVIEYNKLGQVKRETSPTEVYENWGLANEDQVRGWQWASKEYDWKGRVTRETGFDNVDRLISYNGCGCAGGQLTTVKGELVNDERRTSRHYSDILGRSTKTEILDYEDNVYSTEIVKYDSFNNVVKARKYAGTPTGESCVTGTCEETIRSFDGFGRLKSEHSPNQDAGKSTQYSYTADGQLHSVTDARNASARYSYETRGLVSRIDYSLPNTGSNFPTLSGGTQQNSNGCNPTHPDFPDCGGQTPTPTPTPNPTPYLSHIEFEYDAVGNRKKIIDSETGTTMYS